MTPECVVHKLLITKTSTECVGLYEPPKASVKRHLIVVFFFFFLISDANRLQSAVMIISVSGGALGPDLVVKGWRGPLIPVASSPHIPSLKTSSTCYLNRRKNMTGL